MGEKQGISASAIEIIIRCQNQDELAVQVCQIETSDTKENTHSPI